MQLCHSVKLFGFITVSVCTKEGMEEAAWCSTKVNRLSELLTIPKFAWNE